MQEWPARKANLWMLEGPRPKFSLAGLYPLWACLDSRHLINEEIREMNLELWLAFVAASAVMLAIPGPTILTALFAASARRLLSTPRA